MKQILQYICFSGTESEFYFFLLFLRVHMCQLSSYLKLVSVQSKPASALFNLIIFSQSMTVHDRNLSEIVIFVIPSNPALFTKHLKTTMMKQDAVQKTESMVKKKKNKNI